MHAKLLKYLSTPRDPRGLAAFRAMFGAILLYSTLRFVLSGWVDDLLLSPSFHFTYPGFSWVRPWPRAWMYVHFAVMALGAVGIALGYATRICAGIFLVTFTYVELIDKTTYLNHYYFVSLMTLLLIVFPGDDVLSLRAQRQKNATPQLAYLVLRLQVAVVYLFAGIAKLNADWLFRAEPLRGWLGARVDIFPLLGEPAVAYFFSWAGALFDLSVVFLLLVRKTRGVAYLAVVLFHLTTALLFPIGVFPWVMMAAATLLFEPSWPERWLRAVQIKFRKATDYNSTAQKTWSTPPPFSPLLLTFCALFCALQLLLPLRHFGQTGAVNWGEQGFRFSWRVMLIEKAGMVEYEVVTADGKKIRVFPRKELTPLQYRMMSTQPDMIADYARHLAQRYNRNEAAPVKVYARSFASLNRRPSQVLVNPEVNLASDESLPSDWILPLESN